MRRAFLVFFVLLGVAASCHAATVLFAARVDIPTQLQQLTGIAVADFNGDGHLDFAVTSLTNKQVTVYLNDGTGTFSSPVVTNLTPAGNFGGLTNVVAADVNEDGKQDLVVSPLGDPENPLVLFGNGDGTFTPGPRLPAPNQGFLIPAVADLNGDGHVDLVLGALSSPYVELGDGKGNFTDKPLPQGVTYNAFFSGLTVGDFNGDGHPDFVATITDYPAFNLWTGAGDGTFTVSANMTADYLASAQINLASADFNADGKLDLLLGEPELAVVIFGNGDGTFQTADASTATLPLPYVAVPPGTNFPSSILLATADMDGDGAIDVAAADDNAHLVSVVLNDGTGRFAQPAFSAAIDPGTLTLNVADLNGDGLPDLIVTNNKTQNISVFLSVIPKATPSITVQSSAAQVLVGGSVTISVQVKDAGKHTPTGTVTLTSGTTTLGQQTLDGNGQASVSLSHLAVGLYPLVASYSGDQYNASSKSPAFSQAVTDFQISVPSATQSVDVRTSASYAVTLTPEAGFSGMVSLSCAGLPTGYSCAPVSVAVSGQVTTATLVVSPPTSASAMGRRPLDSSQEGLALAAAGGFLWLFRRRRGLACLVMFTVPLLVTQGAIGCSSGSTSPAPYTGTSEFTVTGAATQGSQGVSHQATATLTVH